MLLRRAPGAPGCGRHVDCCRSASTAGCRPLATRIGPAARGPRLQQRRGVRRACLVCGRSGSAIGDRQAGAAGVARWRPAPAARRRSALVLPQPSPPPRPPGRRAARAAAGPRAWPAPPPASPAARLRASDGRISGVGADDRPARHRRACRRGRAGCTRLHSASQHLGEQPRGPRRRQPASATTRHRQADRSAARRRAAGQFGGVVGVELAAIGQRRSAVDPLEQLRVASADAGSPSAATAVSTLAMRSRIALVHRQPGAARPRPAAGRPRRSARPSPACAARSRPARPRRSPARSRAMAAGDVGAEPVAAARRRPAIGVNGSSASSPRASAMRCSVQPYG